MINIVNILRNNWSDPQKKANLFIFSLFLVLSLSGVFYHEFWVDEARAWLISRDTPWLELLKELRYEHHPPLWYIILKISNYFISSPLIMKLYGWLFGVAAFYLVAFYSPFSRLQKFLLSVNYYLLFEYTMHARPYSIMLLLCFSLCVLYPHKTKHTYLYIILNCALANTHFWGILISLYFMFDLLRTSKKTHLEKMRKKWVISYAVMALPAFVCLIALGDGDHSFWAAIPLQMSLSEFFIQRLINILSWDFRAWFMLLQPMDTIWNGDLYLEQLRPILALAFILFVTWIFYKIRNYRFVLYLLLISFLFVFSVDLVRSLYDFNVRHSGLFFITFIMSIWLIYASTHRQATLGFTLTLVLLFQAYSGGMAYYTDLLRPHSRGKDVANFLQSKDFDGYELVPELPFFSSSYLVYLDKNFFSYFEKRDVTFSKVQLAESLALNFDDHRDTYMLHSDRTILKEKIDYIAALKNKPILLVSYYPMGDETQKFLNITKLAEFEGASTPLENFYIYKRAYFSR